MNTEETLQITCTNVEQTKQLARKFAANLKGGEVVELASDLGGGKTTFVKFLVETLGSEDDVSSPSFTIENVYKTKTFEVHHFDFYRLEEVGIMGYELDEALGDNSIVTFIEWASVVDNVLPEDRLKIVIKSTGDTSREVSIVATKKIGYMLEGLQS